MANACAMTQNFNKCTHYLRAISTKIEIISKTKRITPHLASDLSSGRRPKLKSNEKCGVILLVFEIQGRDFGAFLKKVNTCTYWNFGSDTPICDRDATVIGVRNRMIQARSSELDP